jgi:uncharacterized protein (DUF736 family)
MTDALTNFIQIDGKQVSGNIATLTFDIDVTGQPFTSGNDKAPKFRLFAKSPRGRQIEIGGIWERLNQNDERYYSMSINTGHSKFYANLGKFPGQDDDTLFAVIPNEWLNSERRG